MVEKLRAAYYPDPTNGRAVRDGNIALLTNLFVSDYELQAIALQADANNREGSIHTYLFRLEINANLISFSIQKYTFEFLYSLNRFSVHDAFNLVELLTHIKYEGATHTDDVCYMFQ